MLVYGIPEFRLPKAVVEAEVEYIKKLGVEMVLSAETARRLPSEQRETASLSPLPAQRVKGFSQPVEVLTPATA